MDHTLLSIKAKVYNFCGFKISEFIADQESKEYDACQFQLNGLHIISRSSKITPKKTGQFVTFWKRNENGPITPFDDTDTIDFFIVNVKFEDKLGQFVFPRSILIKKGILTTDKKEGKRGFRVYSHWDVATSNQAIQTQKWQLAYFYTLNTTLDIKLVKGLYLS